MSGSGKKRSKLELGHDAFLDIVANLVGILIILVVVLGSQSTTVIEEIKEQQLQDPSGDVLATEQQLSELAQQSMRAAAAQADSDRIEKTVVKYQVLIDQRDRQRAMLLDLLAQAKAAWEEKKKELDQQATELASLASQFDRASEKLAQLKGQRQRLEEQPEQVVAVAHLPTPMAKTVFGDELHFRLKDNRLSVVPVDQLLDEIRRDFQRVAAGPRSGLMDAAVGPIRGYVARYEMAKDREMVSRGGRVGMSTRIQLVGMKLEPLSEPHGQPIEKVLSGSSELDIELAGRDPGSTSITVWVYPDSFATFRKLKELLYAKGFATAGRPLPIDQPITGSPHGSRSRAQ
jgi:hypothetical protein